MGHVRAKRFPKFKDQPRGRFEVQGGRRGVTRDHEQEKRGEKRKDPNCAVLSRGLEFGHMVGKGERRGIREGQWLVARTQRQKIFRNNICFGFLKK